MTVDKNEEYYEKKSFGRMQLMRVARLFRIHGRSMEDFIDSHECCSICEHYNLDNEVNHLAAFVWTFDKSQ